MRLASSVLVSASLLYACSVFAAEPCAPRPLLPVHSSAFVPGRPDTNTATPSVPTSLGVPAEELRLQADCLVWESRVQPKAELLEPVPLGLPPSSLEQPSLTAPRSPRMTVVRIPVGPAPQNPFAPPEGAPSFRLGITAFPAP